MKDVHKRANDAVKLGEHLAAIAVIWLAIFGLMYIALLGPEIQQWRSERIDVPAEQRDTWADYPNDDRCGWSCISRIPSQEEWPNE